MKPQQMVSGGGGNLIGNCIFSVEDSLKTKQFLGQLRLEMNFLKRTFMIYAEERFVICKIIRNISQNRVIKIYF